MYVIQVRFRVFFPSRDFIKLQQDNMNKYIPTADMSALLDKCGLPSHILNAFNGFAQTGTKFSPPRPRLLRGSSDIPVKYYDPRRWPKHWTAVDFERLLGRNLANPKVAPNYKSLAMLLQSRDFESLRRVLADYVKAPEINVDMYLQTFLGVRMSDIDIHVEAKLKRNTEDMQGVERALSVGGDERHIVICHSLFPWVTTEFVRSFLSTTGYAAGVKCGRVLFCPSDAVLQDPSNALCRLSQEHVEAVTGFPESPANFANPVVAYNTWEAETERLFHIPTGEGKYVAPLVIVWDADDKLL
ncbi:Bodo-specific multi-copy gene family, putative, partial [Bodo saltans]